MCSPSHDWTPFPHPPSRHSWPNRLLLPPDSLSLVRPEFCLICSSNSVPAMPQIMRNCCRRCFSHPFQYVQASIWLTRWPQLTSSEGSGMSDAPCPPAWPSKADEGLKARSLCGWLLEAGCGGCRLCWVGGPLWCNGCPDWLLGWGTCKPCCMELWDWSVLPGWGICGGGEEAGKEKWGKELACSGGRQYKSNCFAVNYSTSHHDVNLVQLKHLTWMVIGHQRKRMQGEWLAGFLVHRIYPS